MDGYDILIPGNYFCDLIFTGVPRFPMLGSEIYAQGLTVTAGGVLNTVIALRRLECHVGWTGLVGNDLFSQFVLELIEREGVDRSLLRVVDEPFQRVTVSISYPHDRAMLTYVDPAPTPVQLAFDVLDRVQFHHLHFTGFQLDSRTVELFEQVRGRGITISMDCQDRPITLETPRVRDTIMLLDIFMPNAKEAMQLTGTDSISAAAAVLRPLVNQLIIKDGAKGAYAWEGERMWFQPALSLATVDTTGAGDVFNAGFLAARLEGCLLKDCLRWGTVCGGLSTLGSGGTSTAPTRTQVEEVLGGARLDNPVHEP